MMLSGLKFYIGAALSAVVASLYMLLRLRTSQRDKARSEAERQSRARKATEGARKREQTVAKGKAKVKRDAQEHEREKADRRRTGERPSGRFGDRLRDDD